MNGPGPASTPAGVALLQGTLPTRGVPAVTRLPTTLPIDPANMVGSNPGNVIIRNLERVQEETQRDAENHTLDITR